MISKKIFFIIFLQFSLFANSVYNINFLDFQAKVFPKIILLDNNFEDKLLENSVVLTILYEEIDYSVVEILKDKICPQSQLWFKYRKNGAEPQGHFRNGK